MLAQILDIDHLKSFSTVTGLVAGLILSIGIINTRFVAPFLARPLAKALRSELTETIEAILLSDAVMAQFNEQIEEVVVKNTQPIVQELVGLESRVTKIEVILRDKRPDHLRTRSTD